MVYVKDVKGLIVNFLVSCNLIYLQHEIISHANVILVLEYEINSMTYIVTIPHGYLATRNNFLYKNIYNEIILYLKILHNN
jgi:hypothetical protein